MTPSRTTLAVFAALLLTAPCVVLAGDLPDPVRTPGVTNPNVTQDNLATTVCVPNWTSTVRPSVGYTNKLKAKQMTELGLSGDPHKYEEDHRIPLACGGNPTDPENLSPEAWDGTYGAHVKDVVESYEHRALCKGKITLAQCQAVFAAPHDWRDDYDRLFGPRGARQ